jgi:uncharacterized membrane protein
MPMQATTTSPLFAAALKPDRSPGVAGGWLALSLSALATTPFALLVPEVALPALAAFAIGGTAMTGLTVRQTRYRRMRQQVTLWADQLEIVLTDGKGAKTLRRFNPKAVRLILKRDDNERTLSMRLRSGKEELELGAFLKTEDRSSFARAFGTALRRARLAKS